MVVQLLVGEKELSRNVRLYRRNFIRLLDKALEEYYEARKVNLAQIEEFKRPSGEHGTIIYIFNFTNHIETCINSVARLYKLLDRIKSEPSSPILPREIRRLVETQSASIANIRNAIEHMDKLIFKGEIDRKQPIMLVRNENNDGVVIADYEIKFEELAMVLRTMHKIAQHILKTKKQKS